MRRKTDTATVLIVEDEPDVRDILDYLFTSEGYQTLTAVTAAEAWDHVVHGAPDVVVLDVELPDQSGLDFCRGIRPYKIPVIMVSSHDRDAEVVAGLETGAADYVRKPFNNRELLLRVRRLIDQSSSTHEANSSLRVAVGELLVDRSSARVWRGSKEIELTPTEWNILDLLVSQRGNVQSIEDILEHVWHTTQWEGGAEMVKVNIRRLRAKVEDTPHHPQIVLNRRGRGYLIE